MKNYYEILGIKKIASPPEIKKAYFRLVKIYHPDINQDAISQKKFVQIKEAYEVLYHPQKRTEYDQVFFNKLQKEKPDLSPTSKNFFYQNSKFNNQITENREELSVFQKTIVQLALSKIFFISIGGLIIGFSWIFILDSMTINPHLPFLSLNSKLFLGAIASSIIAFIISLDNFFKIETFIKTTKMKIFLSHFRLFAITICTLFLSSFLIRFIVSIFHLNLVYNFLFLIIVLLLSATMGSDGEFWHRIKQKRYLESLIIFTRIALIGLLGALLGIIISLLFWIHNQDPSSISNGLLIGLTFAIIVGSINPKEIQYITSTINSKLKYPLLCIIVIMAFSAGVLVGNFI
jgi:hypothetical protein